MFCPNCGKEIDDSSKFCKFCGAKIEKNQNTNLFSASNIDFSKTVSIISSLSFIKKAFPSSFGLALLMFLFPFMFVSCTMDPTKKISLSGLNLAFGTNIGNEHIQSTLVLLVFLFGLVAFVLSIIYVVKSKKLIYLAIPSGLGILNLLILIIFRHNSINQLNEQVVPNSLFNVKLSQVVTMDFTLAFWLCLFLNLAGSIIGIYLLKNKDYV
ncbi:zinc ribbon domain-containing protein [Desulfurella sp.]|uniref:zinc ribbon domain-containing protein n=1 Tax=Desulfurella sp. TaxID=1962857 RepID=UPI0025B7CBC7|nr:zinc ribbon domain-containing protein [Desulfurella sp.]